MDSNEQTIDPKIQTVLQLVFSSKRAMPAHFTSDDKIGRTQSFLIDSPLIVEADEYSMASSAHKDFYEFFPLTSQSFQDDPNAKIGLKVGEDLMIGAYLLTKTHPQADLKQLHNAIVEEDIRKWDTFDARPFIENPVIQSYLDYCLQYGKTVAEGRSQTDRASLFDLYLYQTKDLLSVTLTP